MSGRPGPAIMSVMSKAGVAPDAGIGHLMKHVFRIAGFILIAYVFYCPFGGNWTNHPAGAGWDENKTSASWDTRMWDWDFVDCFYFAMCTMTTVGYGDMPTLRQEMRVFTIFFGAIGVVFVASSINVIADWFSEQGRKKFIAKQRVLLQDAHRAAAAVRAMQGEEGDDDGGAADGPLGGRPPLIDAPPPNGAPGAGAPLAPPACSSPLPPITAANAAAWTRGCCGGSRSRLSSPGTQRRRGRPSARSSPVSCSEPRKSCCCASCGAAARDACETTGAARGPTGGSTSTHRTVPGWRQQGEARGTAAGTDSEPVGEHGAEAGGAEAGGVGKAPRGCDLTVA